ncbi:ubiquitin-protein ligase E3A [Onthophagus taurus]|uniref:ubiquitin-protein ligase E3A n=1 Tax=Onthophagus taurus TaxID=166361 RepID=UPI000C20869C|nr:ubiquitin-protein ligase E3A [Onthophagus taurus]
MSSPDRNLVPDDASRTNPEASSSGDIKIGERGDLDGPDNEMKRAAAKKLIERYFYQLIDGCGNSNCNNIYCRSSESFVFKVNTLSANEAAAQAIQLFSQDARLCERHPNKMPRTHSQIMLNAKGVEKSSPTTAETDLPSNDLHLNLNTEPSCASSELKTEESIPYLTEQKCYEIIDLCEETGKYVPLVKILGAVFSNMSKLSNSFLQNDMNSPIDAMLDKTNADLTTLKKEDVRSLEGEKDKDEDSCVSPSAGGESRKTIPIVDLPSVRRAYRALFKLNTTHFEGSLVTALVTLASVLEIELKAKFINFTSDEIINIILIVFEIPALGTGDFVEMALPMLCRALEHLSLDLQAKLALAWSGPGRSNMQNILENLQQLITLRVITGFNTYTQDVQDDTVVTSATKLMKILYYANILAGVMESPDLREEYDDLKLSKTSYPIDPLATMLGVNVLDSRKPFIPFSEFYNEPLSDTVEMDRDFANFKSDLGKFSFMTYSFILTPPTKTLGLYFDNRIRMFDNRRISFMQSVIGQPSNPYLRLKVRRDHIIDDALVELEMIAMENPIDLKKQLVVEFENEQGIDEGGVSKEFFQLVIEEIFNPDYAMFTYQQDSQTVWFNPTSFENEAQFTLIGIVLGLAIYNNIILAVNFPMVLYRKLMGKRGSFEDLSEWNPTLYNSLKQMLEYNEPDLEDVFMQTFRISYQDVFGGLINHDLKENGDQVAVTQTNKFEFVEMYADFLLNKSVEKQFRAFYKGFQMVTDESPLELLFRPEEVELLICGSKTFNFNSLEQATEYDGGYTSDSPIIKHFWSVVHAFSIEEKRKLLQFTTGSDRVPIGGLSKLKLVIAKNGPDSDRLPTAHTCFNVLLLPEYSSKEKLKDRLVKAINYYQGFGML